MGELIELASKQDGLVTRPQLRHLGLTRSAAARLRRDGVLQLCAPNVFALGGIRLDVDRRLRAALLQAGDLAVVSHASAAHRWAFPRIGEGAVEVVVPHGSTRPRSPIGRVHVSRNLAARDVVIDQGLPVTTPRRTILDLGPRLGSRQLTDILRDLRRRSLLDLEDLAAELGLVPHRGVTGVVRLDALVDAILALPKGTTYLEDAFIVLLAANGRRLPKTQVPITIADHDYLLDNFWPDVGLVVEVDGELGHATKEDRRRDAERAARITGLGYALVRFTYDDVEKRPTYCLEVVDRHLALRARLAS